MGFIFNPKVLIPKPIRNLFQPRWRVRGIYDGESFSDSRDKGKSKFYSITFLALAVPSIYFGYEKLPQIPKDLPSVSSITQNINPPSLDLESKLLALTNNSIFNSNKKLEIISNANANIPEIKQQIPQDYEQLKAFYEENKDKLEKSYVGKLDVDNRGNLEYLSQIVVYKPGNALITYKNGKTKEISGETLDNFLVSTLLEEEILKANNRVDLVTDSQVILLQKKYPNYVFDVKTLMVERGIYTKDKLNKEGKIIEEGTFREYDKRIEKFTN